MNKTSWYWSLSLLLSSAIVGLVTFVYPQVALRPIIVMWFVLVCPGMSIIRLLHLRDVAEEWGLAIALSCALAAIIASILMYAGRWSSGTTLMILILLCTGCSLWPLREIVWTKLAPTEDF